MQGSGSGRLLLGPTAGACWSIRVHGHVPHAHPKDVYCLGVPRRQTISKASVPYWQPRSLDMYCRFNEGYTLFRLCTLEILL